MGNPWLSSGKLAPFRPHSTAPLSQFRSATVTFSLAYTAQYDQAGLLLALKHPSTSPAVPPKWIKAGVELYNNVPRLSTVCCDRFADWSVARLPSDEVEDGVHQGGKSVTILIEKQVSADGVCLWVYYVAEDGKSTMPLREVCWVFGDGDGAWELEVSGMAARPNKDVKDALEASFESFEVQWEK